MARGQDAPTRTGGGIDPYVQSSMQQSKQLAGNRLVTAMQEKGATERAGIASGTQLRSQQMQSQTSLQMQAAQSAADDKRAAEAERGRREDMAFNEKMVETNQLFETKRDNLRREHELLLAQGRTQEAEKIRKERREMMLIGLQLDKDAADRAINTSLSVAKMMFTGEADKQKAITTLAEEGKKDIRTQNTYAQTIEDTTRRIKLDKRMDLPVKEPRPAFRGGIGMTYALPKEEGLADPMAVMQDRLASYNPNLEVANLSPDKIHNFEQQIIEKKIVPEDIVSAFGVITGMKEVLEDKIAGAGKEESVVLKNYLRQVEDMEESLISLKNSKKQVKDSKAETVGVTIRSALGAVYPGLSTGSKVNEIRKTGKDWGAVLDELTKGRDYHTPLEILPGMSPGTVDFRTQVNSIFQREGDE